MRAAPVPAAVAAQEGLLAALHELAEAGERPYYDAEADEAARAGYYEGIDPDEEPAELYRSLAGLVERTHATRPAYRPSLHVYPWVDLHPDRKLRGIYSGKTFEPEQLIRADLETERLRAERLLALATAAATVEAALEEIAALEAALPYNCEHVVPQSWFAKREPMRGDLHHLFTCESRCNSFRGNTPYFDFEDFEEVVRHDCGKRERGRFEPSDGKGPVARAVLYFLLRYPGQVDDPVELETARLPILLAWHEAEPPGEYELHRNAAVFAAQGNRNPVVDHPSWAGRIDFAAAFAGAPSQ